MRSELVTRPDCYQEARTTAGFIQGVKMTLPTGFNRKDSKKFEEVNIPAGEKAPLSVGNKLVPISRCVGH